MSKLFESQRAKLWLGAMIVLVLGFLVAAVLLPSTGAPPGESAPDVRVPRMENVPPSDSRLKLDVEKDERAP